MYDTYTSANTVVVSPSPGSSHTIEWVDVHYRVVSAQGTLTSDLQNFRMVYDPTSGLFTHGPIPLSLGESIVYFLTLMVDGRATDTEVFGSAGQQSIPGTGAGGPAINTIASGELMWGVEATPEGMYSVRVTPATGTNVEWTDIHFSTTAHAGLLNYRMLAQGDGSFVFGYIPLMTSETLSFSFTYNQPGLGATDSEILLWSPATGAASAGAGAGAGLF